MLVTESLIAQIATVIDNKTKPRGALGLLEGLAARICEIQQTVAPALVRPTIAVFAADHGLARESVSAYPREVTAQMALNVLAGGAGINVFSRQHGIELLLVDAGVDWPEGGKPDVIGIGRPAVDDAHAVLQPGTPRGLVDCSMGPGTASSLTGDAMTDQLVDEALRAGGDVAERGVDPSCTIMGFGELGIGNTSAASLLVSALTGIPLTDCVGPGTGLVGEGLSRKLDVLQRVRDAHPTPKDGREALRMFGGFEIAEMAGAMLRAAALGRVVMIDGFVATAALLAARSIEPSVMDNTVFCHESGEPGHVRVLDHLGVDALLHLKMRLGEGSGCAVAYPVIVSAVAFVNEMASFDDAGVSTGEPESADR